MIELNGSPGRVGPDFLQDRVGSVLLHRQDGGRHFRDRFDPEYVIRVARLDDLSVGEADRYAEQFRRYLGQERNVVGVVAAVVALDFFVGFVDDVVQLFRIEFLHSRLIFSRFVMVRRRAGRRACVRSVGGGSRRSRRYGRLCGCGSRLRLFFPGERLKFFGRFGILPGRFTRSVDDERGADYDDTADNQYGEPYRVAARRNLAGRDKAENEGQQGAAEAESGDEPDQAVAFSDPERALLFRHFVTQYDGRAEHQQVHDQIQQHGQLRQDLIERLHGGHDHEQQAQYRNDASLDEQDVALYAGFVGLLEERRQIPGLSYREDTLRRAGDPCQHAGQYARTSARWR